MLVMSIFGTLPARADLMIPTSGLTVDVKFSSAPNIFGSPSWDAHVANALASLEGELGNIGDRNVDPTAYEVLMGTYEPGDVMVTSFPSWRGVALPGAPFAGERGNRLHAGLRIFGDGTAMMRLNDLEFALTSSDGALDFMGDFVGLDFNCTTRYGVHWGADRVKGGVDDSVVCGVGSGSLLVDELVYVGVGNAYWPGGGPVPPGTEQSEIDAVVAYINNNGPVIGANYSITGTDSVVYSGSASLALASPVPEPATSALLLPALAILGWVWRRQRA